jgi:hypothetical protein
VRVIRAGEFSRIVPRGTFGRIWEDMGGSNGFFENRVEKKQGSKMALNGFLFEKRAVIAESMVARQEGCF